MKTVEEQFKEETGLNAYEPNNMRPSIPEDVYVEWLEDKIEQLAVCGVSNSNRESLQNEKLGIKRDKLSHRYNDN